MATLSALRVFLMAVLSFYALLYHGSFGTKALATGPPGGTLRVDLVRRDSHLSPLLQGQKLSIAERLSRAIERSRIRLRRLQEFTSHSNESYYSPISAGDSEFLMQMGIGSPVPLNLHFILDTGSDLIWAQCEPCGDSCLPQIDPIYNPFQSSSYTNISCSNQICAPLNLTPPCDVLGNCIYNYEYGDGSYTKGVLGYERFSLATAGAPTRAAPLKLAFGCGRHQGGDNSSDTFSDSAGIIGLDRGRLSLISQIGSSIFSYCLGSIYDDSEISSLFVGPAPTCGAHVRITPLIQSALFPTFYHLSLRGISVAGKLLPIPKDTFQLLPNGSGGLIIDSGTTITFLVDPAYNLFLSAVKSNIQAQPTNSSDYDLCYNATSDLRLPTITFHFAGGSKYVLPQNNSFIADVALLCLAFSIAGPPGSLSIFGNVQQQNFHIVYDLLHNQLSFAHTKCASR